MLLSMFYEIMSNNTSRNPFRVWNILTIELLTVIYKRSIETNQW